MKYNINMSVFGNTFPMPCDIADKHLKIATLSQLKVLICFMRNISDGINPENISRDTALPISEVEDALVFWSQCGILNGEPEATKVPEPIVVTTDLPSRADVIKRGLEDERLAFLLREAQLKFGRNLKQNESSLLVSLYDDNGMDVSVILLLLGYAASEGKCNLSFIRKTAISWIKSGVETVSDAERIIKDAAKQNLAWSVVRTAFGIEKRKPSEKELTLSDLWVNEWNYSTEMLRAAYDVCIDANAKISMAYISKVLERWHASGFKTVADITTNNDKKPQKYKKGDYAGYDLSKFEQMLDDKINGKG